MITIENRPQGKSRNVDGLWDVATAICKGILLPVRYIIIIKCGNVKM